jgi:hypothetical protein
VLGSFPSVPGGIDAAPALRDFFGARRFLQITMTQSPGNADPVARFLCEAKAPVRLRRRPAGVAPVIARHLPAALVALAASMLAAAPAGAQGAPHQDAAEAVVDKVRAAGDRRQALPPAEAPPVVAAGSSPPPPLAAPPPAAVELARPAEVQAPPRSRRAIIGGVAVAVGAVALGTGVVFGLEARTLWEESQRYCGERYCSDQRGVDLAGQAATAANIATGGVVLGGALVAGGLVLYLTAPKATAATEGRFTKIVPTVKSGRIGVNLVGRF